MACSEGLASDIEQALDMVPIQMLKCIEGGRRVSARTGSADGRNTSWNDRPTGTPEDFVAMAMGANVEGLEVVRGG